MELAAQHQVRCVDELAGLDRLLLFELFALRGPVAGRPDLLAV
jgi:hypothetical protein